MDRAIIIGNCQAQALEIMLSTNEAFTDRFELVSFPAVHEMPEAMVPELHRVIADASVVIPQRIDDGYRGGLGLGTETLARLAGSATVVRWPSVFWAGYFPDLCYLRDAAGQPVVDGPFDYHDRAILQAYASGVDVAGTCRLLEDPERASNALVSARSATAELDARGKDCDIHITSFIADHFREELLFFTLNHPANLLLGFIAQQITEFIGIPGRVEPGQIPDEVLGSTFYPLHTNHVRALALRFGAEVEAGRTPFKIRGVAYEPEQAVQAFFDYYRTNPQLVELNLDSRAA
jgi:Polysaccharide biosynthesis enzyme WcbI